MKRSLCPSPAAEKLFNDSEASGTESYAAASSYTPSFSLIQWINTDHKAELNRDTSFHLVLLSK